MLNSIEAERVRNRLTKEELATRLGVSVKTYYNWINEETDVPGIALVKMSRMFGTDIDYLMKGCTGVEVTPLELKGYNKGQFTRNYKRFAGQGFPKGFPFGTRLWGAKSSVFTSSKTLAADERAYRTDNKKGSC